MMDLPIAINVHKITSQINRNVKNVVFILLSIIMNVNVYKDSNLIPMYVLNVLLHNSKMKLVRILVRHVLRTKYQEIITCVAFALVAVDIFMVRVKHAQTAGRETETTQTMARVKDVLRENIRQTIAVLIV